MTRREWRGWRIALLACKDGHHRYAEDLGYTMDPQPRLFDEESMEDRKLREWRDIELSLLGMSIACFGVVLMWLWGIQELGSRLAVAGLAIWLIPTSRGCKGTKR